LRGTTGTWNSAVLLDAGIVLLSFVLPLFVRESREPAEESAEAK
jgi:hypothetical protein